MQQPIGLALRIMEDRAFERAKRALETAKRPSDLPNTPMVQMVKSIRGDAWMERMQQIAEYPS